MILIDANPLVYAHVSSFPQHDCARSWLDENRLRWDPVWAPQPTEKHSAILGKLFAHPSIRGNLIPDAHLAAPAIEEGLVLCSTDGNTGRRINADAVRAIYLAAAEPNAYYEYSAD